MRLYVWNAVSKTLLRNMPRKFALRNRVLNCGGQIVLKILKWGRGPETRVWRTARFSSFQRYDFPPAPMVPCYSGAFTPTDVELSETFKITLRRYRWFSRDVFVDIRHCDGFSHAFKIRKRIGKITRSPHSPVRDRWYFLVGFSRRFTVGNGSHSVARRSTSAIYKDRAGLFDEISVENNRPGTGIIIPARL